MLPPFLPRSPPPPLSGGHPQSVRAPEANREVDHHGARKQVNHTFFLNSRGDGGDGGGDGGGGEVDHHGTRKHEK